MSSQRVVAKRLEGPAVERESWIRRKLAPIVPLYNRFSGRSGSEIANEQLRKGKLPSDLERRYEKAVLERNEHDAFELVTIARREEVQIALVEVIENTELLCKLMSADLGSSAKSVVEAKLKAIKDRAIDNLFQHKRFLKASQVAFYVQGDELFSSASFFSSMFDLALATKSRIIFTGEEDSTHYKLIGEEGKSRQLTCRKLTSLDEVEPDLLVLPFYSQVNIPQMWSKLIQPRIGKPKTFCIGTCYDYQLGEALNNPSYFSAVDEVVTERRVWAQGMGFF